MATISHIGILNEDGTVDYIYCHWDGYPGGVGQTLFDHYKDEKKIRELIALGTISTLGEKISPPNEYKEVADTRVKGILERFNPPPRHTFDSPLPGVTVAYHRDRGDDLEMGNSTEKAYMDRTYIDYRYLFKNGEWYCDGKLLSEYDEIKCHLNWRKIRT